MAGDPALRIRVIVCRFSSGGTIGRGEDIISPASLFNAFSLYLKSVSTSTFS